MKRHIISILLENEAGALSRVAGLFSALRITGTISPASVCVAMPRCTEPLRVTTPASSS